MHARTIDRGVRVGLTAVIALAMLTTTAAGAEAQEVTVQAQTPPPPQYQPQPQPYYAPQPVYQQPVYAQPVYAQPVRQGTSRTVTRPNVGLIVSGAVLLGGGWVANIITGLPAGDDPFSSGSEPEWDTFRGVSLVPVAGPWIQLGVKPTTFSQDYWAPWLIIDGLMQVAGITMLVIGIATPRTETVVAERATDFQWALVPQLSPGHAGAAFVGTF